jgi:DNA-binding transcriptional ArsR family regulator
MKIIKLLDREGIKIVSDSINHTILKDLVTEERSISELAKKLNIPPLKVWRHMQKLLQAGLVELARTQKVGNIEKKLYRATAVWFAPQQYFEQPPKDATIKEALEIYTDIQHAAMAIMTSYKEVPEKANPIDFGLFVNMKSFVDVYIQPSVQEKVAQLEQILNKYINENGY